MSVSEWERGITSDVIGQDPFVKDLWLLASIRTSARPLAGKANTALLVPTRQLFALCALIAVARCPGRIRADAPELPLRVKIAAYRKNDLISAAFAEIESNGRNRLNIQMIQGSERFLFFMSLLPLTVVRIEPNGHQQFHGISLAA